MYSRNDVRQAFVAGYKTRSFWDAAAVESAADRYMAEKVLEPGAVSTSRIVGFTYHTCPEASSLQCDGDCHLWLWADSSTRFTPSSEYRCQCGQKTWGECQK